MWEWSFGCSSSLLDIAQSRFGLRVAEPSTFRPEPTLSSCCVVLQPKACTLNPTLRSLCSVHPLPLSNSTSTRTRRAAGWFRRPSRLGFHRVSTFYGSGFRLRGFRVWLCGSRVQRLTRRAFKGRLHTQSSGPQLQEHKPDIPQLPISESLPLKLAPETLLPRGPSAAAE